MIRRYPPGPQLVSFAFLGRKSFLSLALTGFFYNLGVWVDKFVFWANPLVSDPVIGPLRASIIYDIPIFLAYLSIVPGHGGVSRAGRDRLRRELRRLLRRGPQRRFAGEHPAPEGRRCPAAARQGMGDIFKVQGVTLLVLFLIGDRASWTSSASRPCTASCSSSTWPASAPRC